MWPVARMWNRMNLAHLVLLAVTALGAGVALAAARTAGVLQPQDALPYDAAVLMSGLIFAPGAIMFGVLFWRERYALYLAGTLLFGFSAVFTPAFVTAMGG